MGLSIHFSGYIKEANLLPNLIEEIKDVAEAYSWKYHIYDTFFPNDKFDAKTNVDKIYGISFTPTNCETISFTFLSNGRMVCPIKLNFFSNSKNEEEKKWIYTNSVKTQYGGVQLHQFIIHFLKYLSDKYFNEFNVSDESDYWGTGDEEKMKSQFKVYDSLVDNFKLALETFPKEKDEDMLKYFERLIKHVNDLKK